MRELFSFVYRLDLFLIILIVVFVILVSLIMTQLIGNKTYRLINTLFYFAFLLLIFYKTVFSRNVGLYEVILPPFNFITGAREQYELYRSFYMNILFFVPFGLSMPYMLSMKPYKRNIFLTITFAVVLSVSIEFLQYRYNLGVCETDDVIANTLGAAIGTLSYCLYMKIIKNQEKGSLMQKTIDNNQKLLLDLCAKSLFDKDVVLPSEFYVQNIIDESNRQTVFSLIYSFIKRKISDDNAHKRFSQIIAKNIRVEYSHNEVHRVLSENNIPYVIIKGVASASYYKEPMLRMMGDVDVLVAPENIAKANELLNSIGFVTTDDIDGDDMHIGYNRKDGIPCELHRRINGVPNNDTGKIINRYVADIFEKSEEHKTSNGSCIVPSKFHHGLILLLHTANHLTHEGVGLRHICDWAVFVNSMSNDDFMSTFDLPLKEMGLWRFAQLLTLCCIKYLVCDKKSWAGDADDTLLEGIITDILTGGNFGYKDPDRYSHIKYISNRQEGTVGKKNTVLQLLSTINAKTKKEFIFANKSKFLLLIGWIFTVGKYLYMVIIGKRSLDSTATISSAKKRKNIYNEFELFKNDQE